jgi:hypothetical protein
VSIPDAEREYDERLCSTTDVKGALVASVSSLDVRRNEAQLTPIEPDHQEN